MSRLNKYLPFMHVYQPLQAVLHALTLNGKAIQEQYLMTGYYSKIVDTIERQP